MQKTLKSVSATEIKNRFGDYLGEVVHAKEPILVKRHGRPVAVLVSLDQWKRTQAGEVERETAWVATARQLAEKIDKKHPQMKSFSAVDLIRKIRDEEG